MKRQGLLKDFLGIAQLYATGLQEIVRDWRHARINFFRTLLHQIYFTCVEALPMTLLTGFALGAVVVGQLNLSWIGAEASMGRIINLLILRELSPIATLLIVMGHSGSAVVSEIATMKVAREIEALDVMGINTVSTLISPRILAGGLSTLFLCFALCAVALAGGFLAASAFFSTPLSFFLDKVADAITLDDAVLFFLKNFISGSLLFGICAYYGLSLRKATIEVPMVTKRAVSVTFVLCIFLDMGMDALFYAKNGLGL